MITIDNPGNVHRRILFQGFAKRKPGGWRSMHHPPGVPDPRAHIKEPGERDAHRAQRLYVKDWWAVPTVRHYGTKSKLAATNSLAVMAALLDILAMLMHTRSAASKFVSSTPSVSAKQIARKASVALL